jgi:Fe-S-cluster containining protein
MFLERDGEGRTSCSIHPVRPDACRDWEAGLDKKECRQGLVRAGDPDAILLPLTLYETPAEAMQLVDAIKKITRG